MSNLDQGYLLETVSEFVAHVVLPGIAERDLSTSLIWTQRDAPDFQGSILPVMENVFRVALNTGVADRLFEEVQRLAEIEDRVVVDPLAVVARSMGGIDRGLNLIFVAGLTFVALHETAHAAAGHIDYTAVPQDYFAMMTELEADGAAAGLIVEFAPEIADMILPDETPPVSTNAHTLGVIIGILLALSATPHQAAKGYPDRIVRVMNAIASIAWRVSGIELENRNGDWKWPKLTNPEAEHVSAILKEMLLPPLMALNASHGAVAGFPDIFASTDKDEQKIARDVLAVMAGGRPGHSKEGQMLNELSDLRPDYLKKLAAFRRSKLWSKT